MIAWLIGSRLGRALSGLVAALGIILGVWAAGRREGAQRANEKVKDNDRKEADAIRNRVERDTDKRVSDFDANGWRD